MLIKQKATWEISENLITPEEIYLNRRKLLQGLTAATAITATGLWTRTLSAAEEKNLTFTKNTNYFVNDPERPLTKEDLATSYNNFYEFSLEKEAVKTKVADWKIQTPWQIEIYGPTDKSKPIKKLDVDSIVKLAGPLEERIYRFRCVEAWSMVVPWVGFPLANLIKKLEPSSKANFIKFQTFSDPSIGKNIKSLPNYPWPYTEGLTMKEALHPLSFFAVGMYGKALPKQNGAPIRLVVPWKYGFKSIKSIVKIEFTESQPKTLWNTLAPAEYSFEANVNPKVDHPRWSQARERVLNGSFIPKKIDTLPFNGYASEVAALY